MRSKKTLTDIADVSLFYQYLYMNEEHKITFNNGLADLTLSMKDNLRVMCKNDRFPDLPPMDYSENLVLGNILGIIDRLKCMPAIEHPLEFRSRWEEIYWITKTNWTLNQII